MVDMHLGRLSDEDLDRLYTLRKRIMPNGELTKRAQLILNFGYDTKKMYHLVRLLSEVRQLLETGDMDLERDNEIYKSVRRGEWSLDKLKNYFSSEEKSLKELYDKSTLPYGPPEEEIKTLLLHILEEHYGSLSAVIVQPGRAESTLDQIQILIERSKLR